MQNVKGFDMKLLINFYSLANLRPFYILNFTFIILHFPATPPNIPQHAGYEV